MSVAKLNVEIGARIAELQKGLRNAERELRRSGNNFARIGGDLTTSLSAPLGLLGTAAISAAGDIESLTLALKSQLGSSEAAAKELGLLTEAAKNPGLGVEQAVRGSVRLQGVGLAAEEAREVLVQMGNAIAATGGSAQELDSVTRQFAQMISKGRVLQEDVSILSENMPGLAQMMQKAFGTQSVENIRAMGVSGKEFVMRITEAAKELPRVEGGIKNSIGNAVDALKQSAAKLGFALNEAFDITGTIERVTNAVLGLVNWFGSLSAAEKEVAISLAAVLAASGPLVRIWGNLTQVASLLVGGLGGAIGALKAAFGAATALEVAMQRVKLAFGIIGIVSGLAVAVYALADNFDAAEFAADQFADGQKAVIDQTSKEIGLLNKNFEALKDETKSRFDKGQVVDALLKQYPQYLKGIDLESASVGRLTELQKNLNDAILKGVAERQKASAVTAIYEEQAKILLRIQQLKDGAEATAKEATLINTGDMIRAGSINAAVLEKMQMQAAELGKQVGIVEAQFDRAFGTIGKTLDPAIQKEYEARDAYYEAKDAISEKTTATVKSTAAVEASTKASSKYRDVLNSISATVNKAKLFGDDADIAKVDALKKGMEDLIEAGFKPASKEVQNLKKQWDELTLKPADLPTGNIPGLATPTSVQSQSASPGLPNAPVPTTERALTSAEEIAAKISELTTGLQDGVLRFGDAFSQISEIVTSQGTVMQNVFLGMGEAISQAAAEGATSFAQLGKAAAGAAAKIIRAYIQQGVAAAVAKALSSVPFPFNLAAGAAAGGIAAALFTNLIGKIGIKAFASGTRDAPGGLSLVGERGPELVNLPKHSQVFSAGQTYSMMKGGSAVEIFGEFRVKGTDLVLVLEREQAKQKRFR